MPVVVCPCRRSEMPNLSRAIGTFRTPRDITGAWVGALSSRWWCWFSHRVEAEPTALFHLVLPDRHPSRYVDTREGAIKAYADAFLHGSPSSYFALQSKSCSGPSSAVDVDAYFSRLRSTMEHLLGRKLSDVQVLGAQVRNQTSDHAEAQATFNIGSELAGTDNWVALSNEGGQWRVSDCGRAPFGGSSQSASASAVN